MGLDLRYSAWTLPWLLDFKQKVASIPTVEGSGTGQIGLFTTAGRAGVTVNLAKFGRIDEVIADDEGSLIRVYDGGTIIDEWIAKRGSRDIITDTKTFPLSGSALPSIFDQYLVPAFDDPANPVEQGNWQWGADNILTNPSFEDNQVTPGQFVLTITATGGTYTLSDGTDTTSAIAFNAVAGTIETELQSDIAALTDVVVISTATTPRTFLITLVDPAFGVTISVNTGSLTGGTATITASEVGGLSPKGWMKASVVVSGAPQNEAGYTAFEVSSDHAQDGIYSLKIDPGPSTATSNRWLGAQQIVNVKPGLYQGSIYNYPTNGTDPYRLSLHGMGEEYLAVSANTALTANTFSQLTITDAVIPEGNNQIIFRAQNTLPGPSDPAPFYLDLAELYPGLPATDPGDILTLLFDAHSEIGNWIDYSSISGTDSNGDAYPEDISFEVQWGEHYGHVLDRMVDLGYEWELVPKATPVGTLTHDFHLYISGGRDSDPDTAINKGQSVTEGDVVKRIPDYTSVTLEGAGGAWTKATDTTAETNFGVLEKFVANRQLLNEATRVLAADAFLAYEEANRTAARVSITASLVHPRPLVDYRPGDTIPWQIPPALPKEERRVQRIDYTNTSPTTYVVTGSRLLDGQAAAYDLIWRLWRRFNRPTAPASAPANVVVGGGGTPTIVIAAYNATDISKSKADLICVGINDQNTINSAWAMLDNVGGSGSAGGRLVFTEGDFHISSSITYGAISGAEGYEFVGIGSYGGGHSTTFMLDPNPGGSNARMLDHNGVGSLIVRNIAFFGNGNGAAVWGIGDISTGGGLFVEHCLFSQLLIGVRNLQDSSRKWFINNKFENCGIGIRSGNAYIVGNTVLNSTGTASFEAGIYAIGAGSGHHSIVAGNLIVGGSNYGIISNGAVECRGNVIHNNADSGIFIDGVGGKYIDNYITTSGFHGIQSSVKNVGPGSLIQGNTILDPQRHGMFIDMVDCLIFDNQIIGAGQAAANTYDGIVVDNNNNYVSRNYIDGDTGQTRYGINIAAGSDSIVVGNQFNAAADYGTDPFNDSGTATITNYPADATYGDNFVR